jgi:hypothetical protein
VINMMSYSLNLLYQAERRPTEAERRQADLELGLMAARVSSRWRRVTRPVRALRASRARPSRVACGPQ